MMREKDDQLGAACTSMADAADDALDWAADNEKRLGLGRPAFEREMKKALLEARKLANAARRPMSAAVFGPSQAGKSFLVGKILEPEGKAAQVVFGQGDEAEKLNFLQQVNPTGGKETTGIVTRFSTTPMETPKGFPVHLRLLREIDIVKILCNTFVWDLSAIYVDRQLQAMDHMLEVTQGLSESVADADVDALDSLAIIELREYFEDNLKTHPFVLDEVLGDAYWSFAETSIPRLPPDLRVRALSILWGGIKPFDDLYRELKGALDQLSHAQDVYTTMDAIRDRANGVLHIDRIYELSSPSKPGAQPIMLTTAEGLSASLRMSIVTALTLELRVVLDGPPWPYFAHTDFLDFPGARPREQSNPHDYFSEANAAKSDYPPREYCFLRGKVSVLFENYVADFDLNSMLLCVPDSNMNVPQLPGMIETWVARTHGATPEERTGKKTSLFYCQTKFDRVFEIASGGDPEANIRNRMDTNFSPFPGWTKEWDTSSAFKNTFPLRNPKAGEILNVFNYEGEPREDSEPREEVGFNDAFAERTLPRFREAFLGNSLVRSHINEPEKRWDDLLKLNDGGVAAVAEALGPVCDPDLKYSQVIARAERLKHRLTVSVSPYYEHGDLQQRIEERTRRAREVLGALIRDEANPGRRTIMKIGAFLDQLHVSEHVLEQTYVEFAREGGAVALASAGQVSVELEDDGIDWDGLGLDDEPVPQESDDKAAEATSPESFGALAISKWLDHLYRKVSDEELCASLGIQPDYFHAVVEELQAAANRLDIAERVNAYATRMSSFHQSPHSTAHVVALGSALLINDFVADLGRAILAEHEDEDIAKKAQAFFLRPKRLQVGEMPDLGEDTKTIMQTRSAMINDWIKAFQDMVGENAASSKGQTVDPEQNARLGRILQKAAPNLL